MFEDRGTVKWWTDWSWADMESAEEAPPYLNLTPGLHAIKQKFLDLSHLNNWCDSEKPCRDS